MNNRILIIDKERAKMYLEDTPIKKQKDDLLHRRNFAKRLGQSLVDTRTKDGCCVGLYGPWGSGKSSVVNMVLEEIDNIAKENIDKPVVMYFNPWNFSSSEQLLRQYFVTLANEFSTQKDRRLNTIGNEIKKYAEMFEIFGDVGKVLGASGKIVSRYLSKKNIIDNNDISKQKELIIKRLREQEQKIIIVIDDIDRLSNDEIKLIFQLVNTVAKFPNTIYLLSFDKEIVARALTEVQRYDGEKYLEKIIQVPIEIPEISNDYLWEALFSRLNEILNTHKGIIFEQEHWGRLFSECVSKYIANIRDIVRLINALSIKADMIGGEVNFADLVAITVIELKLPKLYGWIKNNQSRLTGGEGEAFRLYGKTAEEIKESNLNEMKMLTDKNAVEYIEILNLLFPYYASKTNSGTYYTEDLLRRKQRIGHRDVFKRYFVLEVDDEMLSREEVDYAIFKMNQQDLEIYLEHINENNNIISFLKELRAASDEIKENRVIVIIKALVNKASTFTEKETNSMFSISAFSMVQYDVEKLFLKIPGEEERYFLLAELINGANENALGFLGNFINSRELAYGRLAANGEQRGETIISLEQLEKCEEMFEQKVKKTGAEKCLLDLNNARMILYLFESFNKTEYQTYMQRILLDDLNKLKYLAFSVEKWTSGSLINWKINDEYKKMLTDDEVNSAIVKCEENGDIWKLTKEELHRVIAFILKKENKVNWDGEVYDKSVGEYIEEMKNNN